MRSAHVTTAGADDGAKGDPRVGEILDIVAKETAIPRERLTPETKVADLNIASLDMVQAIFALESRFDVEVPVASSNEGGEFETVGDLVQHVLAAINAKDGNAKAGTVKAGA